MDSQYFKEELTKTLIENDSQKGNELINKYTQELSNQISAAVGSVNDMNAPIVIAVLETHAEMMGKMWGQEIIDTAHKIKKSSEYTAMYIPVKDEQP